MFSSMLMKTSAKYLPVSRQNGQEAKEKKRLSFTSSFPVLLPFPPCSRSHCMYHKCHGVQVKNGEPLDLTKQMPPTGSCSWNGQCQLAWQILHWMKDPWKTAGARLAEVLCIQNSTSTGQQDCGPLKVTKKFKFLSFLSLFRYSNSETEIPLLILTDCGNRVLHKY